MEVQIYKLNNVRDQNSDGFDSKKGANVIYDHMEFTTSEQLLDLCESYDMLYDFEVVSDCIIPFHIFTKETPLKIFPFSHTFTKCREMIDKSSISGTVKCGIFYEGSDRAKFISKLITKETFGYQKSSLLFYLDNSTLEREFKIEYLEKELPINHIILS